MNTTTNGNSIIVESPVQQESLINKIETRQPKKSEPGQKGIVIVKQNKNKIYKKKKTKQNKE